MADVNKKLTSKEESEEDIKHLTQFFLLLMEWDLIDKKKEEELKVRALETGSDVMQKRKN